MPLVLIFFPFFWEIQGGEASSVWPSEALLQSLTRNSSLLCLSRMLQEQIHADVTITTPGGSLRAHKAVLAACSPVFQSMFLHDCQEKESSIVELEDISLEACSALLNYLYGVIRRDDFWLHRQALLAAANKYNLEDLKGICEESLLDDLTTGNVLDRLRDSCIYQLHRLKKGCLTFLFDFGRIYDVREEMNVFFRNADRDLIAEMFQEILTVWKSS